MQCNELDVSTVVVTYLSVRHKVWHFLFIFSRTHRIGELLVTLPLQIIYIWSYWRKHTLSTWQNIWRPFNSFPDWKVTCNVYLSSILISQFSERWVEWKLSCFFIMPPKPFLRFNEPISLSNLCRLILFQTNGNGYVHAHACSGGGTVFSCYRPVVLLTYNYWQDVRWQHQKPFLLVQPTLTAEHKDINGSFYFTIFWGSGGRVYLRQQQQTMQQWTFNVWCGSARVN